MDWLKDALVARQRRELQEQWRRAGEALAQLLQDEAALKSVPPEAAWTVVNSVWAGLRGVERGLRQARGAAAAPEARRALGETAFALGSVIDLLERYGVPGVEKLYGVPPAGTRWSCGPIGEGDKQGGEGR